ncbi:MAG: pyridoxamine 5'-phosphate oxidase family protein [Candidatus Omnitrophica bacterium]|nr:pyridoxamine 5'-phosphate oxidase family protein [Candidatus Omnitrophota bacterium]
MKTLSDDLINFLERQSFSIVSTLDEDGGIHCAAKGIVGMERKGKIFLIDLYKAQTFKNLQKNPTISITSVDENMFMGYTLKGKAKIVERSKIENHVIKTWEERLIGRISKRLIKSVKDYKKSGHHPEAKFPHPEYLIEVDVESIVDLTPSQLKKIPL